jgi:hypothetical protein
MSQVLYRIETTTPNDERELLIHEAAQSAFPKYRQIVAYTSPEVAGDKGLVAAIPVLILDIVLTGGATDRLLVHRLCESIKKLVEQRTVTLTEIPILRRRIF